MSVKIIANLGPVSIRPKTLQKLNHAGMDIARLKSCFYTASSLDKTIKLVRKNSAAKIMIDFEGSEIRIYGKKEKPVHAGKSFWLGFAKDKENRFFYFNHDLFDFLKIGDMLVYDKSVASVVVKKKVGRKILFETDRDLVLRNGKGFNVGSKDLEFENLSSKDMELIDTANKNRVDFAALSFTQSDKDILNLKKLLHKECFVCAKIENHEGLKNLSEITRVSDIVMVARGDLSAEFPIEEIPRIQNKIISVCKKFKKPVIVATDILETMKYSKVPLNSEISDLVSISRQGADMILITSPTAIGKFPVETVQIAKKTLSMAKKFARI